LYHIRALQRDGLIAITQRIKAIAINRQIMWSRQSHPSFILWCLPLELGLDI
jgi:hypothetical protein